MTRMMTRSGFPMTLLAALAAITLASTVCASSAQAAAPAWSIRSVAKPSYVSPTTGGNIVLLVTNDAAQPTDGSGVTISDTLPTGLVVTEVSGTETPHENSVECQNTNSTVTCTFPEPGGSGVLAGDNTDGLSIDIKVAAESGVSGTLTNTATVSGGGASNVSSTSQVTIGSQAPPFGLSYFNFGVTDAAGRPDIQAGDHPNAVTVGLDVNSINTVTNPNQPPFIVPAEPLKTVTVDTPLGLVGNPQAAHTCPQYDLAQNGGGIRCPTTSIIGSVAFTSSGPNYFISSPGEEAPIVSPLFNAEPEHGYPAEFAFNFNGQTAFMYASVVHTSSGYALRTTVPAVSRAVPVTGVQLTFFGDPAVREGNAVSPRAFFTDPVNCSAGPLSATIKVNSWAEPTNIVESTSTLPAVVGCNRLQFEPKIEVKPQTTQMDSPTGMTVDLKVPQNEDPGGLATPELKDATLTLPLGMSVSPPSADGLRGCPATGAEGIDLYAEEPGVDGQEHLVAGHCPQASQIGTVKITTPLLASPLQGHVYLAQPKCGGEGQAPCTEADATNGNLFGLYIEAEGSGVNIKLPGTVSANSTTGQLTAMFKENPQLPFSDLELTLNGGPHAPLANPQSCGQATATSDLVPWSTPATPDATPTSFFNVDWNGAGGACPGSLPFAPSFSAGTVTPTAGAFSPFTMTLTRKDGEQDLGGVTLTMPPGVAGMLSKVPLCGEPQASAGTCPEASRIGTVNAAAGAGSHPFWLSGPVYLTGPYNKAPFGLSIVVPAKAGPFNLGNVVERATINVDPHTAQVTVADGPLQQSRDGVPFRLKALNVTIDRAGFMFNPTNCSQLHMTGTISGAQGASANVSSPFAVTGCKNLPFKPKFTASTSGKTSRQNGTSLKVRIVYPGANANLRSVKVKLPKQLPSRLSTLQKACADTVFNVNPAACPAASRVGTATTTTPVLPVPLSGPVYFVSHGTRKFPDLVMILQGDGVTVILDGETFISKQGITSTTFRTVPDVPFSSFELNLPKGAYSALTNNGNLCKTKLLMPTALTGQNGAVIKQNTKITVTDCPKAKKKKAKRK